MFTRRFLPLCTAIFKVTYTSFYLYVSFCFCSFLACVVCIKLLTGARKEEEVQRFQERITVCSEGTVCGLGGRRNRRVPKRGGVNVKRLQNLANFKPLSDEISHATRTLPLRLSILLLLARSLRFVHYLSLSLLGRCSRRVERVL